MRFSKWCSSVLIALFVFIVPHGNATLVFKHGNDRVTALWLEAGKIHYRNCKVIGADETRVDRFKTDLLPECERDAKAVRYSVGEDAFGNSVASLYTIPTKILGNRSARAVYTDALVRLEQQARVSNHESTKRPKWLGLYELAQSEIFQHLPLEKARFFQSDEGVNFVSYFTVVAALSPTYHLANGVFVYGKTVPLKDSWDACSPGWALMSESTLKEFMAEEGEAIQGWVGSAKLGQNVLVWEQTQEPKMTRDGREAYLFTERFKEVNLVTGKETTANPNQTYATICFRREVPRFRKSKEFPPTAVDRISIKEIAAKYNVSVGGLIARLYRDPSLEMHVADFFLSKSSMPRSQFELVVPSIEVLLGRNLPQWDLLEAQAVQAELAVKKKEEEAKKEAARIAAEKKQAALQAQQEEVRRAARERHEAAQRVAEEQRHQNSTPLYAQRSLATPATYTYGGRYISREEYIRRLNDYNFATYGRHYYDRDGFPVNVAEYNQLNQPAPTVSLPAQSYSYVPVQVTPVYVVPVVPVVVYPIGGIQ